MLVGDTQRDKEFMLVGGNMMQFSLSGEGTNVSMHFLHALFVLIV